MVIVTLALSYSASLFMDADTMQWYDRLRKSPYNPPAWAFGVVWPLLYILMSVAAWRIWQKRAQIRVHGTLTLYAVQLAVNLLWTALFFGLRDPQLALLWLLMLLMLVVLTLWRFYRRDKLAALLLLPYHGWLCFACYLNTQIVFLNAGFSV